jgi:hypothetical protein
MSKRYSEKEFLPVSIPSTGTTTCLPVCSWAVRITCMNLPEILASFFLIPYSFSNKLICRSSEIERESFSEYFSALKSRWRTG